MHVLPSCTRHHLHALEVIQAPRRYKYGIIGKQSVESISGMTSDFSTHVLRESTKEQRVAKRAQIAKKADGMPSTVGGQWQVLESGVLATPSSIEVLTDRGRRRIWYDPRGGGRLVCEHGWGAYHLSAWNGPRSHRFPKPCWTTCDCCSATGLCGGRRSGAKRRRCESESGDESDCTVLGSHMKPPAYYEVLAAQHGITELRTGLYGARALGVRGADGEPLYMVKGDAASVLRCRHGHTTNTLAAQARERRRHAASLVAAALLGPCAARKALGGVVTPGGASRGARKALVHLLQALQAAREARRGRRGTPMSCGCMPVHVKACVVR